MDQNAVVIDLAHERETGDALLSALAAAGFPVDVAFWAQVEGDDRRFLYVASPDASGGRSLDAYRAVADAVRRPGSVGLWRDSFDIKLVSPAHPMAVAARAVIAPRSPGGPFAVPDPKASPTMTRFNGSSLGGISIEGPAYIYPPYPPGLAARATP